MITTYYDPGFAAPIGSDHIMPIQKFNLIADNLKTDPRIQLKSPLPLTEKEILKVHTSAYLQAIRTGEPRELAESQKFPWTPNLYSSVCLTGGGCLAAARHAVTTGISAALVSGFHHAFADHGEGFCTFNSLVITLDQLREENLIQTAAILDMDLHYGNGTASFMETRPEFLALSIYGNDYNQNQAFRDVNTLHHQDGPNHHSFPLPTSCNREVLFTIMDQALPLLLKNKKPDLLLYQAGADPYYEDPYSPLSLDHADLFARDKKVFQFAKQHSIPIAWVLAGGYTKDIQKVVQVHLNTFLAAHEIYAH